MSTRVKFFSSSVGTKILLAVTGLALFLFLVGHLAANLLIFVDPEMFNAYSDRLIKNPLIYVAEAGLVLLFLVHVYKAVTNWAGNRSARPESYATKKWAGYTSRKSLSSSSMIVTGVIIFVFVVLHVRTFKFGAYYEAAGLPGVRDLHRLVLEVFQNPFYVVFYVVAMGLIFMHLNHGLSSAMQSAGVNHPRINRAIIVTGSVLAAIIGAGFAIIPLWVYFLGGRS
jgi:succinate dehydrogenase / fumarate reductase, cytochrome b subunit